MTTFKVGDLVQLKSGGPTMTVDELSGTRVWAVWFSAGAKRERELFAVETLFITAALPEKTTYSLNSEVAANWAPSEPKGGAK
jgi:uncharacterized protein YodC (DUF2158 family)